MLVSIQNSTLGTENEDDQGIYKILAKIVTTGKKKFKSVYDPTCGSGSLLLRVAREVEDVGNTVSVFQFQAMARENNIAFIDGQNLHLGITSANWKFDLKKFRVFLRDKYHIEEAYYFLGYVTEGEDYFYNALQKAGFIVSFREHSSVLK